MKRRCNIELDPALRAKVHQLILEGRTISQITEALGLQGVSRPAVGRYVRRYRMALQRFKRDVVKTNAEWPAGSEIDLQRAGTQEQIRALYTLMSKLARSISPQKEAAVRAQLRQLPQPRQAVGATPEAINFIKSKILGLDT